MILIIMILIIMIMNIITVILIIITIMIITERGSGHGARDEEPERWPEAAVRGRHAFTHVSHLRKHTHLSVGYDCGFPALESVGEAKLSSHKLLACDRCSLVYISLPLSLSLSLSCSLSLSLSLSCCLHHYCMLYYVYMLWFILQGQAV